MALPIALQLYTVRDPLQQDLEGTLGQVAEIGYEHVELAGLYGKSPAELASLLNDAGLKPMASHDPPNRLKDELPAVLDQARTLGYDLAMCPFVGNDWRTPDGYRRLGQLLADAHAAARQQGVTVAYHNHAFEFEKLADGSRGMDILFDGTQLHSELDVYWVQKGGDDPQDWLAKLSGRVPVLHVKDLADDGNFAEVGTGQVDIAGLVDAAPNHGVRWLVVEQDGNWIDGDPIKSARVSYENLKRMVG